MLGQSRPQVNKAFGGCQFTADELVTVAPIIVNVEDYGRTLTGCIGDKRFYPLFLHRLRVPELFASARPATPSPPHVEISQDRFAYGLFKRAVV